MTSDATACPIYVYARACHDDIATSSKIKDKQESKKNKDFLHQQKAICEDKNYATFRKHLKM